MSEVASDSEFHLFAELLAGYRRATGMTQEELAAASGISARTISDMERGRVRGPHHRTAHALGTALMLDERRLSEFLRAARTGRTRAYGRDHPSGPELPRVDRPVGRGVCELPPEVADVTGRESELARVIDFVDARQRIDRRAAAVIVILGIPGVGKTTFAVHVGHRLCARYPDGCLFVDLRGLDDDPLTPGQVLGRLLFALGVAESEIPASTEERSSLFRALLRMRRVLLVADNAADEAQVRPLFPSDPGSLLLVTTRRALVGLESVSRMFLETLHPAAGLHLLASIIDPRRVASEPAAARRLVELCGRLPLAVRVVGNRLASRPNWTIESLVRQLDDPRHRLAALTAGDLRVPAAFDLSYRRCDEATRHVFRRLGRLAGRDATVDLVATLAAVDADTALRCLENLVHTGLLRATTEGRYALHELIGTFADDRLAAEESAEQLHHAERGLTDRVLGTGVRAGRHPDVLALGNAMRWYRGLRPSAELWREVFTYGVAAARALGRRADGAAQLNLLGWALHRIRDLYRHASGKTPAGHAGGR